MLASVPPSLIAILLVTALLALLPTRRLYLSGRSQGLVSAYFLVLWSAASLAAWAPGALRLIVPIVVIAWLAPFVVLRTAR